MSGKRKREDGSSDIGLSAFAAARARVSAGKKQKANGGLEHEDEGLSQVAEGRNGRTPVSLHDTFSLPSVEDNFPESTDEEEAQWDPQATTGLSSNYNRQDSTENERPGSRQQQGVLSSIFSLASTTDLTDISLCERVDLSKGRPLAVFGQYDLEVLEGAISIYGSVLTPASGKRRIYAWSIDALPLIKGVVGQGAKVALYHTSALEERLDALGRLSPLFQFHDTADKSLSNLTYIKLPFPDEADPYSTEATLWTIALQCNTRDKTQGFTRLDIPCTWPQEVMRISKLNRTGYIQLCGPFGVAETAFTTHMVNMLLGRPSTHSGGICILDLEFSHPIFGPPGQLSLVLLQEPLLGPSYTNPTNTRQNKIIRAHAVSRSGYNDDSEYFIAAVKDLVSCYNDLRLQDNDDVSSTRLIVKHPTWYDPVELEMSVEVAQFLDSNNPTQHSNILCFRDQGDALVAMRTASPKSDLHILDSRPADAPSQPTTSSLTASELHDMQLTSYFHSRFPSPSAPLHWNPLPLSYHPPYTVSWSRSNPDFVAILKLGTPILPHPTLLRTLLTANLVHILVLHPTHASSTLSQRTVLRSPGDDIPYFAAGQKGYSVPFEPGSCETVGVALVVGMDLGTKCFWVVTPVAEEVLRALPRGRTVLVVGGFEAPAWAVMEDEWFGEYLGGTGGKGRERGRREHAPYLFEADEEIGVEGGVGMQAWRVRRFK